MNRIATAMLVLCPSILPAQTLSEWRSESEGIEVSITGHIGSGLDLMDEGALFFVDLERNTYPVVFDAGRNARKALEGCEFYAFGGGTPCAIEGMAEVDFDGSRIQLIIFQADEIGVPSEFP